GENITTYLTEKVRIHRFLCERMSNGKTNYFISTKISSPEELDKDTYYVTVAVALEYNYLVSLYEKSGRGTQLDLIISTKGGKFSVIDAYEALNYYDEKIVMAFVDPEELNAGNAFGEGVTFNLKEKFLAGNSVRSFDKSKMLSIVKEMEQDFISQYGESKQY
ncbi:MAG TPA: hypothetical protein PKH23_01075, partial [Bacillota bacterium]|nr:hypothetical protein [Bacillota bacterium]